MSYEIEKIEPFVHKWNQLGINNCTYLTGFEFKGKKYAFGWVLLNEAGMKKLKTTNPRVKIIDHMLLEGERHKYQILYFGSIDMHKKWTGDLFDLPSLDDYIESVDGILNLTNEELTTLPFDDMIEVSQFQNNIDVSSDMPSPLFKDGEIPELIIGWIMFIILFIVLSVFQDWFISLTLRIICVIGFGIWRTQKIYGIK